MAPPADAPASTTTYIDNRRIAVMRLLLAASALLIIVIEPPESDNPTLVTYIVLSLYVMYSSALYILALRRDSLPPAIIRWAHWIDVVWYALLISPSGGTSIIFFPGFLFAILVASFRWGFVEGLRVVIASAFLFIVVGLAAASVGAEFELNRFLIRLIFLLVLGYLMAYWGDSKYHSNDGLTFSERFPPLPILDLV